MWVSELRPVHFILIDVGDTVVRHPGPSARTVARARRAAHERRVRFSNEAPLPARNRM